MNLKRRSIFAIMLIIAGLSLVHFYWNARTMKKSMNTQIDKTIKESSILIKEVIQNSNMVYSAHLDNLLGNERILSAFNDRNRDLLFKSTLPIHIRLKEQNPYYSNMHFHLPDGHSFLRMHKPEEFGDDLRTIRPIITSVHSDKKQVVGYEVGKHGLFYRIAKPVFYKGVYIGALELGIMAEQVAVNIERVLNVKVARVIHNDLLNKAFLKYCKNEIPIAGMSVNPYKNTEFFRSLFPLMDFDQQRMQIKSDDGKQFIVFYAGELANYQGTPISRFLVAQDISYITSGYHSFLKKSILVTLVLVAAAYMVLSISFGTYIQQILELNQSLEKKVKERTRDLESVTDRLRSTNSELYQIFNTAADGMRVINKNYRIIRVNDTFARLMGKQKNKLENKLCHEDFTGPFCHSPDCTLSRILKGEDFIEIQVEKEITKGEKRSFLLTATPFKSAAGDILGVVENFKDITERQKIFKALKDNERYLNAVMGTVQAGVIITDEKSPRIIDANPYALKMIGLSKEKLKQANIRDHFNLEKPWIDTVLKTDEPLNKEDYILTTASGDKLNIRLSMAKATVKDQTYLVQSFSDMTDVRQLIEKQMVDIQKAKAILDIVNHEASRYLRLPEHKRLFTDIISIPCNAEGGDHYFIHHLPNLKEPKTIISLKDQSGHEVNCILRSIYTDLLHNWAIFNHPSDTLDSVINMLNQQLCRSGFFAQDDFFTSINAQIDHQTLKMHYISAGHPPFLLIRNKIVTSIPQIEQDHSHLPIPFLEEACYHSSQVQLQEQDQLIFYTDGLIEMPIQHLNRTITTKELVQLTQSIVNEYDSAFAIQMPVLRLMNRLLETVSAMCRETVLPGENDRPAVNTTLDDVSILGVEIETLNPSNVLVIQPRHSGEISDAIQSVIDAIFNSPENQNYLHLEKRIRMILDESLVNAWKHGNLKSPEKTITIYYDSRNDFVFQVIDQGDGFDYRNLPDPTSMENIHKPSGRGLFIIRHFSDHVQWLKKGAHIIFSVKKINRLDVRESNKRLTSKINLWKN